MLSSELHIKLCKGDARRKCRLELWPLLVLCRESTQTQTHTNDLCCFECPEMQYQRVSSRVSCSPSAEQWKCVISSWMRPWTRSSSVSRLLPWCTDLLQQRACLMGECHAIAELTYGGGREPEVYGTCQLRFSWPSALLLHLCLHVRGRFR